jgi:ELWxxDGT repeat protein
MKGSAVCSLLVLLALPAAGLEPYLVKNINPGSGPEGSNPVSLVTLGGAVLFFADDSGFGLWRSDGTAAGTFRLSDFGGPGDGPPRSRGIGSTSSRRTGRARSSGSATARRAARAS